MSNQYHFITNWKVRATQKEVYDIISDNESLAQWWPSVYLDVITTSPGDENSIGKRVSLYTKGFLPYTLKWNFVVSENVKYSTIAIRAFGDFAGRGIWKFEQQGDDCLITFDWKLEAEKPLLRYLSFLMKPLFSANHLWAMKKGLQSLELELQRRRVNDSQQLKMIPPPPSPTFPHNWLNNKIFQPVME
jgi:Polyketide cyclase / dehydrase and lipid transport